MESCFLSEASGNSFFTVAGRGQVQGGTERGDGGQFPIYSINNKVKYRPSLSLTPRNNGTRNGIRQTGWIDPM
jgi:hypothetical protein